MWSPSHKDARHQRGYTGSLSRTHPEPDGRHVRRVQSSNHPHAQPSADRGSGRRSRSRYGRRPHTLHPQTLSQSILKGELGGESLFQLGSGTGRNHRRQLGRRLAGPAWTAAGSGRGTDAGHRFGRRATTASGGVFLMDRAGDASVPRTLATQTNQTAQRFRYTDRRESRPECQKRDEEPSGVHDADPQPGSGIYKTPARTPLTSKYYAQRVSRVRAFFRNYSESSPKGPSRRLNVGSS